MGEFPMPSLERGEVMALFENLYGPYVPFGSRNLSLKSPQMKGTDVAILQGVYDLLLQVMNPPQGPIGPPVTIDGIFGPSTKQMVMNIEAYFGLPVDGVAGPMVYFVYGQGVGPNTTYGGPVYGSRQLQQGVSGGDVKILQNRLNTFRYSSIMGMPADGIFGPKTAAAVAAFQGDANANGDIGLSVDSIVGPATFDATWIYTFAGGRGILPGRNGFDVVFVQDVLQLNGFYSGPRHGYYDGPTQAAVRAFQQATGITVDGQVGPQTFYQLGLHNQNAAPTPFPVFPLGFAPTQCNIVLTPSAGVPGAAGTFFVQQSSSGSQLFLTAIGLPEPSTFNPGFTQYTFTLSIPGQMPVTVNMIEADTSTGLWTAGMVSATLRLPNTTTITVYPSGSGMTGPVVFTGSLANCPSL